MKTWCVAVSIALSLAGAGFAQDVKADKSGQGMYQGMGKGMMKSPHHKLAMAYKKNLMNFATALKSEVSTAGKVDKNFADIAVKEMRNSLDQIKKHHEEAKAAMPEDMRKQKAEMVKMMEDRLTTVGNHLDNLEKEVKADTPDPKKVQMEVDQIVKQCEMMKMKMKGKKQMK